MLDQDKFEKLPKYARDEINRLRIQVEGLEAKNAWLEDENRHKVDASNTVLAEGLNDNTALPPFAHIDFYIKDPTAAKRWKSALTVRLSRDEQSIHVSGTDGIVVSPQASNVVHISLKGA
jgi:hypothetical protein